MLAISDNAQYTPGNVVLLLTREMNSYQILTLKLSGVYILSPGLISNAL